MKGVYTTGSGAFFRQALVSALGVLIGTKLIDGVSYDSNWALFWVVVLLGLFSASIKPLLVLFALPFVVLTLGIGLLFINALLYQLAAWIVPGFEVANFGSAFLGALVITLLSVMFSSWINGRQTYATRRPNAHGSVRRRPMRSPVKRDDDVIDI